MNFFFVYFREVRLDRVGRYFKNICLGFVVRNTSFETQALIFSSLISCLTLTEL